MRTVEEWKAMLRAGIREALYVKERRAVAVLRETLAAIENAEAPPPVGSPPAGEGGVFAGSVAGLGAGEVARLALAPEVVAGVVEREIHERQAAATEYDRLDRREDAQDLAYQVDVLVALAEGAR